MKKLLIMLLLVTGCTAKIESKEVNQKVEPTSPPKFAYLTEATVTLGFLKGQVVIIKGYEQCAENSPEWCYTVELKSDQTTWSHVQEKELL